MKTQETTQELVERPLHRLVSRHRKTILAALYLASEYENSLADSYRPVDSKVVAKTRRAAAKYMLLRKKILSANEKAEGPAR